MRREGEKEKEKKTAKKKTFNDDNSKNLYHIHVVPASECRPFVAIFVFLCCIVKCKFNEGMIYKKNIVYACCVSEGIRNSAI